MSAIASRFISQTARRQLPLAATTSSKLPLINPAFRTFSTTRTAAMPMTDYNKPVATIDASLVPRLPAQSISLFEAKKAKQLTFEEIGKALGREEVAVAALFYGQAQATEEDVTNLSQLLELDLNALKNQMYGLPDRGRLIDMPPKEPLIYRLYEIVQNYGYPFKAVMNEKFGDGIMSAISFSTKVEKETDEKGDWVKITLRGKWLPYTRF